MSKLKKIASESIKNRRHTPLGEWIRDKLLAAYRDPKTPPPGLPKAPGESPLYYPHRYPNTQTTRSPPPPSLPDGIYHKLSDNYYLGHDARRCVEPPKQLYKVDSSGEVVFGDQHGNKVDKAVNKGPGDNFGLSTPTPGFGIEWRRSIHFEQESQQKDPVMKNLEKYDRYLSEKH
uniref:NADH dehydrogenase [ubiquinone] 1 alpha subcomplex subunit 7 n=1 Tax=Parastrongyloides trichosuri TaxID=131310 RepID=A0A0N4ZYR6_PARTI